MNLKTFRTSQLLKMGQHHSGSYLLELRAIAVRVTESSMTFDIDGEAWKNIHYHHSGYRTPLEAEIVTDTAPGTMIVIGHYNRPESVRLNIAAIRHFCGDDIPILISDDCSDGCSSVPNPDSKYGQLCSIVSKATNVWLWPNVNRIGHSGGDLGAFWKGLNWAGTGGWDGLNWKGNNGYQVLFKLSQRFIMTEPMWAQKWAKTLMASNYSTLGRGCTDHGFDIRTEAVGIKVGAWFRPDILAHLAPRRVGIAAEAIVDQVIRHKLDGRMLTWDLLSEGRQQRAEGYLFRAANSEEEYDELATTLGSPPRAVTVEDSNQMEKYLHG